MVKDILEKSGKKVVLLGNDAIARGALEAGIGLAASYPGTPSSEVPLTLSRVAKECGFFFEYSTNEKVAFETAAGAAWSGVRAMTIMKHFGLNVASDSVSPVAYIGVKAGYVVVVADDPEGWSSAQSEQDTRYFTRMIKMPMIEPTNPQECLELTKFAFELSEEFEIPVFLRTTTKVNHSIGTVELGEIKKPKTKGKFVKDLSRYYNIRPSLQKLHKQIDEKLKNIEKKYGSKLNKVFKGKGNIGVITSGVSFDYAIEVCKLLGINPPIAKLTLTYPTPATFLKNFIKDKKAILVLEELDPIIENDVERLAKEANPKLVIHGKDILHTYGEYNLERMMPAFEKVFKKKFKIDFKSHKNKVDAALKGLPPRKPVFCPGCPHRSTFYAVKSVFGEDAVYPGDIGCYILGVFEPYQMQDFMISMGSGVGIAHGISKVSDQDIVVFMGDSTFFHAGIAGIVNLKFNDGRTPLVVVMDNSITAMTGHQPHPGSGITGMGEIVQPIKVDEIAKAIGAEVRVVNAFNQKQIIDTLKELKNVKGLRVLVSRGECRLLTKRKFRKKGLSFTKFTIDQEKCIKCGICTDKFACAAIKKTKQGKDELYEIESDLCWGCSVCMQVCPHKAIRAMSKEVK